MSGLSLAKKVGLKLRTGKSISEPVECAPVDVEKILREKFGSASGIFVAWQIQNIVWGKFDGGKISSRSEITPEYWLECRFFNADAELHLKRVGKILRGRFIQDGTGAENFYVDSFARLWGESSGAAEGYVKLLDRQRKLYMEIPCAETNSKWYGLMTRNYVGSDEKTGLSGYVDYRFVAIEPAKVGAEIG